MLKSEIHNGKIYAGETQLACTIRIEQTAPMQLTVRAGTFTHTDGRAWTLAGDAVFDLAADATYPTECKIEMGDVAGVANVWCATRLVDGVEEFNPHVGWNTGHTLAFPFAIPPGAIDLSGIEIFVLQVLAGFPTAGEMKSMGIEVDNTGKMRQTGRTL